jgi:hypothetical protein
MAWYGGFWDYWSLYHKVTFDPINKLILVNPGVTEINMKTDVYSDWKEWILLEDYSKYPAALSVIGGEPTVAGQFVGSTFFLINGWKIRTWEGSHRLVVDGNLYSDDGLDPFVPTLGPYSITYAIKFSNLVDMVQPPVGDIATAVWDAASADYTTAGTKGKELREAGMLIKAILAKL